MDIWEANKISAAYTPHPCSVDQQTRCTGTDCGIGARYSSMCDADGCDFNSYRMGDTSFYGAGLMVDTNRVFTVVTQFITSDGTSSGTLNEIRRFYVQNGKVVPNSLSKISGVKGNSITESFCAAQKTAFGDTNQFAAKGGLATMSKALAKGMVLVMSIWDDHTASMLWLDAPYPPSKSPSAPGVTRGTCSASSGAPPDVEANSSGASVTYSNIKWGPINSTYTGGLGTIPGTPSSSSSTAPATSPTSGAGVAKYGQCGGSGYSGATSCISGTTCTVVNPYYSQCL